MTLIEIFGQLLPGMGRSVGIFFCTLVLSLPLGTAGGFRKDEPLQGGSAALQGIYLCYAGNTADAAAYGGIFRTLFHFWYPDHGQLPAVCGAESRLPSIMPLISRKSTGGGIESMPLGQYEAARLLGYGRGQTFFKIILPQVVKRILPSVTNEVITLGKRIHPFPLPLPIWRCLPWPRRWQRPRGACFRI